MKIVIIIIIHVIKLIIPKGNWVEMISDKVLGIMQHLMTPQ